MIIPKEQRLGYEYRNYHHYAAIILELGTVGKILVTASILDLSNFKFQEFIMMSPIEFYLTREIIMDGREVVSKLYSFP